MPEDHFDIFLVFFCATTLCPTEYNKQYLPLAKRLFEQLLQLFECNTSNIHSLLHVVDEVQQFGNLSTIIAYPFENQLFQIKYMLGTANHPLVQVIIRLSEQTLNARQPRKKNNMTFPSLQNKIKSQLSKYLKVKLRENLAFNQTKEKKL